MRNWVRNVQGQIRLMFAAVQRMIDALPAPGPRAALYNKRI